ncbi:transcriptional regulator [Planktothrix sp. FACHB-1355]|uniref:Transcriptional regulator n=1 Tax=Aerosakkonema funiforme FACHB-1375 TaxID=2949571 RepID=A0A926ZEG3_9CYAN|nr:MULTISPECIES: transcriptional regulator [Oscillatoriales]MBD2180038.1 transcriptional regulator [Aerosakkonema funiforme FACHB-1375]MBD3559709.1 transcriptional regulator [Planktothrix sp. FACHB-1355]
MDRAKRERLEAKGWKVGTVSEFLELTPEETALIEIKLALSRSLKERQKTLSIALAENADASVSIELLIRAMLATGATPKEIGEAISSVG